MAGATNFDKLCHRIYSASGNGQDYLGRAADAICRNCQFPLHVYYCEERLYLVECKTCETKALVTAGNPREACYKTLA